MPPVINRGSQTGAFTYGDSLNRQRWVKEGLVQAGQTSFFNGKIGSTFESPIFHVRDLNTNGNGNKIIFDFDGFLSQIPIEGKAQLSGTGENKKKFSAEMHTKFFANTVDQGWKFELAHLDATTLNTFQDSRDKLANLYWRIRNQGYFDCGMGFFEDDQPTHILLPNGQTDIANLTDADKPSLAFIEQILHACNTGETLVSMNGATTNRPGLNAFADSSANGDGSGYYRLIVDWYFEYLLGTDPAWQKLMELDLLGDKNRRLANEIGRYRNLIIERAPMFQGYSEATRLNKSSVENAGLRLRNLNGIWQGIAGFDRTIAKVGNAFVLGKGGMISGSSSESEYTLEQTNHKTMSEASHQWTQNVKRTMLFEHSGDYVDRKMSGYNLGLINVNYFVPAPADLF